MRGNIVPRLLAMVAPGPVAQAFNGPPQQTKTTLQPLKQLAIGGKELRAIR